VWRDGPQGRRIVSNSEKNHAVIGQPLLNGAVCVDVASNEHGYTFVLAVRTDMPETAIAVDKWVTWEINPKGETFLGHYWDNLNDAVRDFNKRIGG
jgi:hypothetical protein